MTRFPKTFLPPEELPKHKFLGWIIIVMTLGDLAFLWNSFSYGVGDDLLAILMTASAMAGIVFAPMAAAWFLGAALDHPEDERGKRGLLVASILLIVTTLAVIVAVTLLRFSTASVTEGAASTATAAAASFGGTADAQAAEAAQAEAEQAAAIRAIILVCMMTALLLLTAVLSFFQELSECSMVFRRPMIESYRERTAPLALAQIDAILAGIEARSVQVQREDAERIREAEWEAATAAADEIIVDLEKDVAIASEDPASWPIAFKPADAPEGTYAVPETKPWMTEGKLEGAAHPKIPSGQDTVNGAADGPDVTLIDNGNDGPDVTPVDSATPEASDTRKAA